MVDLIIFCLLLIFFWAGWLKGILRSLIGPISLGLSLAAGLIYYWITQKFFYSVLISLFGPIALNIILSIILKTWNKTVSDKSSPKLTSRILGGLFSLLWYGSIFMVTLILIAVVPIRIPGFSKIQEFILLSKTYSAIDKLTGNKIAILFDVKNMITILKDPQTKAAIESSPAYQTLTADHNFKNLFADKNLLKSFEHQNTIQLLSNQKVQAVLNSKDSLQKFMAVQTEIIRRSLDSNTSEEEPVVEGEI